MRDRCGVVMPATNSLENIASASRGQPEPREPGAREGEVERALARPGLRARDRAGRVAQPAPGGGRVLDAEQQEGGRPQVAVPAREEPLDVREVERHSDCTHFEASPPRRPARMRSFCWMLSAVSRP